MIDDVTADSNAAGIKSGYRILRLAKYSLFGLVMIGAPVFGYTYLPGLLTKQPEPIVSGTVTYDLTACRLEYPLLVEIKNGTDDVLTWVSFNVEGRREGYSATLYDSGYSRYSSDRIIASGHVDTSCWSLPQVYYGRHGEIYPPEKLIWTIDNIRSKFDPKFQDF